MKKLSIILLVLFVAISCSDNLDKGKPAVPQVYPVYKNALRVSSIEGKNERWGEFKIKTYYNTREMLDSAWITNKEGRRIGSIIGRFYSNSSRRSKVTSINDYIPSISQDSILRMDLVLKEKYGEGNYSLIDSISEVSRTIRSVTTVYYDDDRVANSDVTNNTPRKELGISGINFNNSYLKKEEIKARYEYDAAGRIIAVRMIHDKYKVNLDLNSSDFDKNSIFKQVITFGGNGIERLEDCALIPGDDYEAMNDYRFNYSGNNIASIVSNSKNIVFARSGGKLTITNGDEVMTYELNGNGYPVRIEDGKGGHMVVNYENGHGDFSVLTTEFEKAMGYPYIR